MSLPTVKLRVNPKTGKFDASQVYDALMALIEPDLVTAVIPTLPEKYKGETAAQKKARGKRYAAAFDEYKVVMKTLMKDMRSHGKQAKRKALASTEAKEREEEHVELQQLESLFLQ